jgi:hypothetical protein
MHHFDSFLSDLIGGADDVPGLDTAAREIRRSWL